MAEAFSIYNKPIGPYPDAEGHFWNVLLDTSRSVHFASIYERNGNWSVGFRVYDEPRIFVPVKKVIEIVDCVRRNTYPSQSLSTIVGHLGATARTVSFTPAENGPIRILVSGIETGTIEWTNNYMPRWSIQLYPKPTVPYNNRGDFLRMVPVPLLAACVLEIGQRIDARINKYLTSFPSLLH